MSTSSLYRILLLHWKILPLLLLCNVIAISKPAVSCHAVPDKQKITRSTGFISTGDKRMNAILMLIGEKAIQNPSSKKSASLVYQVPRKLKFRRAIRGKEIIFYLQCMAVIGGGERKTTFHIVNPAGARFNDSNRNNQLRC